MMTDREMSKLESELFGKHYSEAETPALLLDIDAAERNIRKMAAFFADKPCKLRPHVKTHKSTLIGRMQISAGAIGVTCATLDEAEAFIAAGIKNVLIANQIVGKRKIERLVALARESNLIVCIDDFENASAISQEAARLGRKISVLIEINVGLNRCGVMSGEPALRLAEQITKLPGITFAGLMGYEGGLFQYEERKRNDICRESYSLLTSTRDLIEGNGYPVAIVSAGGTNTYDLAGVYPGITEIQPGSYVTMDGHTHCVKPDFEPALYVLTTVISRPEPDRLIVDAGKKALSTDEGMPTALERELTVDKLSEEHGHLKTGIFSGYRVGDKIKFIPGHGCTTIPLYDHYILTSGDMISGIEKIHRR